MSRLTVGITFGRKFENYYNWISEIGSVDIIQLSHDKNNASAVRQCDGIVLTGGEDVHPKFYNKEEYVDHYALHDFNVDRDEFELEVITHAATMPVLGICRGLQIANVFYGGTLIPDLQSFGKQDHSKFQEGKDRYHGIDVQRGSFLSTVLSSSSSLMVNEVNSAHHQSVDAIGTSLTVNAASDDGVIEGLEKTVGGNHPYFLLVQWHPERLINQNSPFSKNIRNSFAKALGKK